MILLEALRTLLLAYQAEEPPEFRAAEQFGLADPAAATQRPPSPAWRPILRLRGSQG